MKVLGISLPIFTTEFEATVERYVALIGEQVQRRFEVPAKGIEVAKIGDVLVVGGGEEALAPLSSIRATFTVDSINEYESYFVRQGATILQPPTPTPAGFNMIVKGIDNIVFEYVELKT